MAGKIIVFQCRIDTDALPKSTRARVAKARRNIFSFDLLRRQVGASVAVHERDEKLGDVVACLV